MSASKFRNEHENSGQPLFWGRSQEDGIPFRGASPPLYNAQEASRFLEVETDAHIRVFDIEDTDERKSLERVLDAAANRWFRVTYFERVSDKDGHIRFVCAWLEYFMTDAKRATR